jgi:hypothetical protein
MAIELVHCPEITDTPASRCGLPAEVTVRAALDSSDGPIEHSGTRCPLGHVLFMPTSTLERAFRPEPASLPGQYDAA